MSEREPHSTVKAEMPFVHTPEQAKIRTLLAEVTNTELIEWMHAQHLHTYLHQLTVGSVLSDVMKNYPDMQATFATAGALHDIGKFDPIILDLISQPRPLDQEEKEVVNQHAQRGYELLENLAQEVPEASILRAAQYAARLHHTPLQEVWANILSDTCLLPDDKAEMIDIVTAVQVADRAEAMTDIKQRPYLQYTLPSIDVATWREGSLIINPPLLEQFILKDFPPILLDNGSYHDSSKLLTCDIQLTDIIAVTFAIRQL